MSLTRRELIQFMDELVELASEENKERAIYIKEKFISNFCTIREYEREVQTKITELPPYYVAAMPDLVQEEIKAEAPKKRPGRKKAEAKAEEVKAEEIKAEAPKKRSCKKKTADK